MDSLISNIASEKGISEKEVEQDMISKIPAGRLAMHEETAAAAAFLACDEASFITGVNIPVDGGYLKCL
ncbi:MAG: SDR family oxidoreductase [Bacteroidota bacterium]